MSARINPQNDGERLTALETCVTNVEKQVEHLGDSIGELRKDIKDFIESADSKYANKLVEKIVYGLVALVLSSVFVALIALVVKK